MEKIEAETTNKVITPAGLSECEAEGIIKLFDDAEKLSPCFTAAKAQEIVDSLEKIDIGRAAIKYTVDQLRAILCYAALGLVQRLTLRACEIILEIARRKNLSNAEFTKITSVLDTKKYLDCSREMDILECRAARRGSLTNLFAINEATLSRKRKPKGWINVGDFYIKIIAQEIVINMGVAITDIDGKKFTNNVSFQIFHKIDNLEHDDFLEENDPDCEIKEFVKKVILSINKFNKLNYDTIICFQDDKYSLLVMHRYPKKTRKYTVIHQILIGKNKDGIFRVIEL